MSLHSTESTQRIAQLRDHSYYNFISACFKDKTSKSKSNKHIQKMGVTDIRGRNRGGGGGRAGALDPHCIFRGGPNLRVYFYNIASA